MNFTFSGKTTALALDLDLFLLLSPSTSSSCLTFSLCDILTLVSVYDKVLYGENIPVVKKARYNELKKLKLC